MNNSALDDDFSDLEKRLKTEKQTCQTLQQQLELRNEVFIELQREIAALDNKHKRISDNNKKNHDQDCGALEFQVEEETMLQEKRQKMLDNLQNQIKDLETECQSLQPCQNALDVSSNTSILSQSMLNACMEEKDNLEKMKEELKEHLEFAYSENSRLENEIESKITLIEETKHQINELECSREQMVPLTDGNFFEASENQKVEKREEKPAILSDETEKNAVTAMENLEETIIMYKEMFIKEEPDKHVEIFGGFENLKPIEDLVSCEHLKLENELLFDESRHQINKHQCRREEKFNVCAEKKMNGKGEDPPVSLYDEMEQKGMTSMENLKETIRIYKQVQQQIDESEKYLEKFMDEYKRLKMSKDHKISTYASFLRNAKNKLTTDLKYLADEVMQLFKEVDKMKPNKDEDFIKDPPSSTAYTIPMLKQSQGKLFEYKCHCLKQKSKQTQNYKEILQKHACLYLTQIQILECELKNLTLMDTDTGLIFH